MLRLTVCFFFLLLFCVGCFREPDPDPTPMSEIAVCPAELLMESPESERSASVHDRDLEDAWGATLLLESESEEWADSIGQ